MEKGGARSLERMAFAGLPNNLGVQIFNFLFINVRCFPAAALKYA